MKISVDNQIVRLFSVDADKVLNSLLGTEEDGFLTLSWPSFLEYLELGSLFSRLPVFNEKDNLFIATVSALCEVDNPEDLFYIYDGLFTAMLKQVKSLLEMDPAYLLQKIAEKRSKLSFWEMEKILSPALAAKERALRKKAPDTMHDLILYLAWDRMCNCMSRLFDYQSNDAKYLENLRKLKWCLIESYQHIASLGKTEPSFYRLMEALFYYQMREEHLPLHKESDWELLTQSFPALKAPNELIDVFYIDHAVILDSQNIEEPICHLTLDTPEIVQCRLDLARYMMDLLKMEFPKWNFTLSESQIIHLA